jgi:hypothetical protein
VLKKYFKSLFSSNVRVMPDPEGSHKSIMGYLEAYPNSSDMKNHKVLELYNRIHLLQAGQVTDHMMIKELVDTILEMQKETKVTNSFIIEMAMRKYGYKWET